MAYSVELTNRAKKELASLDKKTQLVIAHYLRDKLEGSENPKMVPGAKKLEGVENGWRWRIGVYRILGVVEGNILTITVFKIDHRKSVYKNL